MFLGCRTCSVIGKTQKFPARGQILVAYEKKWFDVQKKKLEIQNDTKSRNDTLQSNPYLLFHPVFFVFHTSYFIRKQKNKDFRDFQNRLTTDSTPFSLDNTSFLGRARESNHVFYSGTK